MKNNKVLNDCGLRNRGIDYYMRQILMIRNTIDTLWMSDFSDKLVSDSLQQISMQLTSIYTEFYKIKCDASQLY